MSEEQKVEEERKAERVPTERIVLRSVAAIEVPADVTGDQLEQVAAIFKRKGRAKGSVVGAWLEVARVTAPTKLAAIEAHAGKAGTPDALVGTFRAPTVTAWKDAEVYAAPPAPLVERTTVD